ncbi:MAG: hypothetical protein Q4C55_09040 [Eubacterium sp.]|nr:hypothetical protein [Eubacterium sp.]
MEWLFSGFLGLLSQVVIFVIKFFIGKIVAPITMSTELFELYFPTVQKYIWLFQGLALCILVVIDLVQLTRGMLFKTANGEVDHPGVLMAKSAFAVIFIVCSVPLMDFFLEIVRAPYTYRDASGNYFQIEAEEDLFAGGFTDLMTSVFQESQRMDVAQAAADQLTGMGEVKNLGEIAGFAISLVLMLILGWQMIRYLLEILERFVILLMLLFTAMFPMAAFPSRATAGIFRKWLEMLFSTALLCFFNMFFLRIISGGFSLVYGSANNQTLTNGAVTNPVFGTFIILAMIRTARSWDHYILQLFTAAETGVGMGWEIMAAGHQLFGSPLRRGFSGGGSLETLGSGAMPRGTELGVGMAREGFSAMAGQQPSAPQSIQENGQAASRPAESPGFEKIQRMDTASRQAFIKANPRQQAAAFFGNPALGEIEVTGLTADGQGELRGSLSGAQGIFADFEISETGGVGAFRLEDGGYLTVEPRDVQASAAFMAALEGSGAEDRGSEIFPGSLEDGFFRAGNLSLEEKSLGALSDKVQGAACTGPGSYTLFDAEASPLGNLEMLYGKNPPADRVIAGERCNYNYRPVEEGEG